MINCLVYLLDIASHQLKWLEPKAECIWVLSSFFEKKAEQGQ
jgi:hypothetical protein